jgi:hypothetical protein
MTGTQHAGIDFEWLMENLEIAEVPHSVDDQQLPPVQTFVLGRKAIFAAEAYVLGLFQLYPTAPRFISTRPRVGQRNSTWSYYRGPSSSFKTAPLIRPGFPRPTRW